MEKQVRLGYFLENSENGQKIVKKWGNMDLGGSVSGKTGEVRLLFGKQSKLSKNGETWTLHKKSVFYKLTGGAI